MKKVRIEDEQVRFASIEDILIHKIVAGRPRDMEDVKSLLIRNRDFDEEYVSRWLRDFSAALSEPFEERFRKIVRGIG